MSPGETDQKRDRDSHPNSPLNIIGLRLYEVFDFEEPGLLEYYLELPHHTCAVCCCNQLDRFNLS